MARGITARVGRLERHIVGNGRKLASLNGVQLSPPTTWTALLARVAVEGGRLVDALQQLEDGQTV